MGSGHISGIACALATGLGVILTSLVSLLGATAVLYNIPIIYQSLTVIGAILLMYFAKRYIQKALSSSHKLIALQDISFRLAFRQAFLVLISNPKMMTTFLAVISLFPIVANKIEYAFIFSLMAGLCSFIGHFIFATIFSSRFASEIYMRLYRPINAFVGIGFIIYATKLLIGIL
jgi:threonine efflux protein